MSEIKFVTGNLFDSPAQTLTNTVNTVGVMGAGIAKEFKSRFPLMFRDYKVRCDRHEVRTGRPYLWKGTGAWVLNFPTKQHWRGCSKIEWVQEGLAWLVEHYRDWGVKSLAMPALGCCLGGLDWTEVKPLMVQYLEAMSIPIQIYEPLKQRQQQRRPKPTRRSHKSRRLDHPELF